MDGMPPLARTCALVLVALLLGRADVLGAQVAAPGLPTWRPTLVAGASGAFAASSVEPVAPPPARSDGHSYTWTGLLVGGLVGGAAAALFLTAFCSDPDTQCGADEVGRAVVIIAVPPAVVGALIGSLIRSGD